MQVKKKDPKVTMETKNEKPLKTEHVAEKPKARRTSTVVPKDLTPLPPPPASSMLSSSSRPWMDVTPGQDGQAATDDEIPDWAHSWAREINEKVDKDLHDLLSPQPQPVENDKQPRREPADKGAGKAQRTGWLNKCAALIQAYRNEEWWKCDALVHN